MVEADFADNDLNLLIESVLTDPIEVLSKRKVEPFGSSTKKKSKSKKRKFDEDDDDDNNFYDYDNESEESPLMTAKKSPVLTGNPSKRVASSSFSLLPYSPALVPSRAPTVPVVPLPLHSTADSNISLERQVQ